MWKVFSSMTWRLGFVSLAVAGALLSAWQVIAPPLSPDFAPEQFAPPTEEEVQRALSNPRRVQQVPPELIDTETLWLARLIYSETYRTEEQELVAWVVRNRVETGYRDQHTIAAVVNDSVQFTPFLEGAAVRRYHTSLQTHSKARGWQRALAIAYYVRHADESMRPFPQDTRHFYSERSLAHPDSIPEWTLGQEVVIPDRPIELEAERFRFYSGIR